MAWVAVDKDGTESVCDFKPSRCNDCFWVQKWGDSVSLPKGSIKKLIGKELTWEDNPIELKEE